MFAIQNQPPSELPLCLQLGCIFTSVFFALSASVNTDSILHSAFPSMSCCLQSASFIFQRQAVLHSKMPLLHPPSYVCLTDRTLGRANEYIIHRQIDRQIDRYQKTDGSVSVITFSSPKTGSHLTDGQNISPLGSMALNR